MEYFPEIIKILRLPHTDPRINNVITSFNYGPYDNGYLVIGTSSGHLLTIDPKNLNRISSQKLFHEENESISCIQNEPTQMIFVSSNKGRVKAVNIVPQKMSYIYLDLGQREYCAIAVNNKNLRQQPDNKNINESKGCCI